MTAINEGTNVTSQTITSSSGNYSFESMAPESYTISSLGVDGCAGGIGRLVTRAIWIGVCSAVLGLDHISKQPLARLRSVDVSGDFSGLQGA